MTLAATLAIGLAACGDATGPKDFDPLSTNRAAADVLKTLDSNLALRLIADLSTAFPTFSSAASPATSSAPFPHVDLEGMPALEARLLERLTPLLSAASPAALFPADLLGKTLVYNPDTEKYEVDPERAGAPATGLRFVLYAVDPVLHQPAIPLDEVGYLDLTDESSPFSDAVGILAVVEGITYLDYTASATVTTTSITFAAEGFLSDGTTDVNFDLTQSLSAASGLTVDYLIAIPSDDLGLHLVVAFTNLAENPTLAVELTLEYGGETAVLGVTLTQTTLAGAITYNGDTVVTISGSITQPVFTDAEGNALTAEQIQALRSLIRAVGSIIDAFDNLLIPAYFALQVSVSTDF